MKTSDLRTRREKILYPLAIIFSAAIWIGAIVTPFLALSSIKPSTEEPCVYIVNDEYRALSMSEAKDYEMEDSCLEKDEIPPKVYQNSLNEMANKKISSSSEVLPLMAFYILFFLFFAYFSTALAVARIRLNGIKISPTQYPAFYKIYEQTAQELGLKSIPNAYIIHASGDLNAFAIKISRKKLVVFYAELVEALVEGKKLDEMRAVIAHELTHVRLKHIQYWFLLAPFRLLPFLGTMFSRARELSADRGAYLILKDHNVVSQALLKLVTGKFIADEVKLEEYIHQPETERGIFIWISKVTATHPPIPYRIKALRILEESMGKNSSS